MLGVLKDLVDVDDGWVAAFEAAVGAALGAVVVDGADAARAVLATLHEREVVGTVLAATSVSEWSSGGRSGDRGSGETARATRGGARWSCGVTCGPGCRRWPVCSTVCCATWWACAAIGPGPWTWLSSGPRSRW